jgi:hypothetical protein
MISDDVIRSFAEDPWKDVLLRDACWTPRDLKEIDNVRVMIGAIRDRQGNRPVRLFAAGSARLVLGLFHPEVDLPEIALVEDFADGRVTIVELLNQKIQTAGAYSSSMNLWIDRILGALLEAHDGACAEWTFYNCLDYAKTRIVDVPLSGRTPCTLTQVVHQLHEMLYDVAGNPYRPVKNDPQWGTETVLGLARSFYDDRSYDCLPILADALMDAGCFDDEILNHCRGKGPHVRGCWVVDLLLGKN